VYVPWNEIAISETIQMIAEDPVSTTITFTGDTNTVVTHQSTTVTDEFGSRSASMVFTGDNHAYLVDENGNDVMELATITTRATEYKTPESMPAKLPPTSAYTYCVELAVDGAQRVRFDKPVTIWVDNFLGFEVGIAAPVGFYNRDLGVWVPEENGRVVKLLDMDSDNVVDALDTDGDDQPDDLNTNGSFKDEVQGLQDAQKYQPGATFWRVALNHFSPCDINWARRTIATYTPLISQGSEDWILPNPKGAPALEGPKPEEPVKAPEQDKCLSSYVENRSRIFHEDIPVPGTDLSLHYASNRVDGYHYGISVPASGETLPDGLKRIIVKVDLAGRTFEQSLDPLPNQKAEFAWDGFDHLGRRVNSAVTAKVDVGFVYDAVYTVPPALERAFAIVGQDLTSVLTRQDASLWKKSELEIPILPRKRHGTLAEGWTLSIQHQLDSKEPPTLHKGDGTIYRNEAVIVETIAGDGISGYSGDGGPATEARIDTPYGLALDFVGNVYFADYWKNCIRKVSVDGIITTVAGNGARGYGGDGGPATEASLYYPSGVAVDSAGDLYIADRKNHRIRKIDSDGIITTVAGTGGNGYSGDQGLATEAEVGYPRAIAVDNEDNLYIATGENLAGVCICIRKVSADGIITTVAGTGSNGYSGDGGPATAAEIGRCSGLTVDFTGNLFISDLDHSVIRKVDTAGIITTVAGDGTEGYSGDSGPAADAQLDKPYGVAVDTTGILYIADHHNRVVRKVDTKGRISTYAGKDVQPDIRYGGDGGPPSHAIFGNIKDVAFDAPGNLYIAESSRVRKVAPPSTFSRLTVGEDVPFAEANGLGYVMSGSGFHKNTIDRDTGVVLQEFGYDEYNHLSAIIDQFNNQITIQRDANGVPTAIISPDNLTTTLSIDANNHLTRVTYPDGSHYDFEYTPDGLMTAEIEPEENRFDHTFSSLGRLTDVFDEQGGQWQYTRTVYENGEILTEITSGEGNVTSFRDRTDLSGVYTSTIADPTGAIAIFSQSADGLSVEKSLFCGMENEFSYDVDSEYKFKFLKELTEKSPGGRERITVNEISYEDTDLDGVTDLITASVAVNNKSTTLVHNILESQKTITSPEGRAVTSLYDPDTLLTEKNSFAGLYDTTYGYDTRGRLLSINTNTRESTFAYNPEGFLESLTDPENKTTAFSYDPVGRITDISRPDGGSVGFTYDKNGNMTVLTNPVDVSHGFGFNTVNRNSSYTTPLSGSYSYIYDKDRRLIQTDLPSGQTIFNDYADPSDPDDKSRLWQIRTPDGNIDFTY
ncbi:MAG: sugar-binding protein, partial [Desulfobacterales bacterium]